MINPAEEIVNIWLQGHHKHFVMSNLVVPKKSRLNSKGEKLGDGGLSAKEWKQKEKVLDRKLTIPDRRLNSVRLTAEQERQWASIVLKKGCIPYGNEKRFQ